MFTEGLHMELKREYTDDIKKTVIAFANTAGGALYIGIDDQGEISGVTDGDDTMLRVSGSVRDSIKPDITLFVDYRLEKIDEKTVVVVDVQKGTASPYYLACKGIRPEGVFVRQGAATVPASASAIFNMIKQTDGDNYEKLRSLNQELTFREADKSFSDREVAFGEGQQISLGIKTGDGVYTNLGLLLSDQCRHTVKMAVYEGLQKEVFRDRREFEGSLLRQLSDAYEFIEKNNRIRAEYKGLQRIDEHDYPEEAIREALLNSLVHREYSFSGSTLISIFEDRMEFVSIGGLVKGITFDDIMLGVSITRNEKLANIFYRLGLIEAFGTGISKILKSYENSANQPVIETTDNAFKMILPNRNIQKEFGQSVKEAPGDEQLTRVLHLLNTKYSVTRKEVDEYLNVSQSTSSRILKSMSDSGLIKSTGKGKMTRYERL